MRSMRIKITLMICIGVAACFMGSCSPLNTVRTGPDAAIQEQIPRAGLALWNIQEANPKNSVMDLRGEMVPSEVRTLEKLTHGDRIEALKQLVYYNEGCIALSTQGKREERGWIMLIIATYYNFTLDEVEHVAKLMPRTDVYHGVPPELVDMAKAAVSPVRH